MFSQTFQGGYSGVEIFSPSGNDPLKVFKTSGSVTKIYDRGVKGFVLALEKDGTASSATCPSSKNSLGIVQPLLIVQLQIDSTKPFSIEIVVSDKAKQRKRLHFSTSIRSIECNELHVRLPWEVADAEWCNVVFNLAEITHRFFRNSEFSMLESFTIRPVCKVRKIFSLPLSRENLQVEDISVLIPASFNFPTGVPSSTIIAVNYTVENNEIVADDNSDTQRKLKPTKKIDSKDLPKKQQKRPTQKPTKDEEPFVDSRALIKLKSQIKKLKEAKTDSLLHCPPSVDHCIAITAEAINNNCINDQDQNIESLPLVPSHFEVNNSTNSLDLQYSTTKETVEPVLTGDSTSKLVDFNNTRESSSILIPPFPPSPITKSRSTKSPWDLGELHNRSLQDTKIDPDLECSIDYDHVSNKQSQMDIINLDVDQFLGNHDINHSRTDDRSPEVRGCSDSQDLHHDNMEDFQRQDAELTLTNSTLKSSSNPLKGGEYDEQPNINRVAEIKMSQDPYNKQSYFVPVEVQNNQLEEYFTGIECRWNERIEALAQNEVSNTDNSTAKAQKAKELLSSLIILEQKFVADYGQEAFQKELGYFS